jgi:hypothetical protein
VLRRPGGPADPFRSLFARADQGGESGNSVRRTGLVFPALALAGDRAEWYSSRLQGRSNEHSGGWLCLPENAAQIEERLGNGDLLHR